MIKVVFWLQSDFCVVERQRPAFVVGRALCDERSLKSSERNGAACLHAARSQAFLMRSSLPRGGGPQAAREQSASGGSRSHARRLERPRKKFARASAAPDACAPLVECRASADSSESNGGRRSDQVVTRAGFKSDSRQTAVELQLKAALASRNGCSRRVPPIVAVLAEFCASSLGCRSTHFPASCRFCVRRLLSLSPPGCCRLATTSCPSRASKSAPSGVASCSS